jgi:hypothetical protein
VILTKKWVGPIFSPTHPVTLVVFPKHFGCKSGLLQLVAIKKEKLIGGADSSKLLPPHASVLQMDVQGI